MVRHSASIFRPVGTVGEWRACWIRIRQTLAGGAQRLQGPLRAGRIRRRHSCGHPAQKAAAATCPGRNNSDAEAGRCGALTQAKAGGGGRGSDVSPYWWDATPGELCHGRLGHGSAPAGGGQRGQLGFCLGSRAASSGQPGRIAFGSSRSHEDGGEHCCARARTELPRQPAPRPRGRHQGLPVLRAAHSVNLWTFARYVSRGFKASCSYLAPLCFVSTAAASMLSLPFRIAVVHICALAWRVRVTPPRRLEPLKTDYQRLSLPRGPWLRDHIATLGKTGWGGGGFLIRPARALGPEHENQRGDCNNQREPSAHDCRLAPPWWPAGGRNKIRNSSPAGMVAIKALSVVARILNRARQTLQHRNRLATPQNLSAMRQTRHISAPAQPITLLIRSMYRAMTHLATRVHHTWRKTTTTKIARVSLVGLCRAIWRRERGTSEGRVAEGIFELSACALPAVTYE